MRHSRVSRALVALAAGGALLLACARFTENDATVEPSPGGADAAALPHDAKDAEPASDGSDQDATPALAPRLPNGDFEAAGGLCGPGWTAYGGVTFERVSLARSGASACRVCNLTAGTTKGIHTFVPADGGATRASAWFRSDPDGGSVAKAWIFLYALYADGGGVPTPQSAQSLVSDEWSSVTVQYPASEGVTELRLHLDSGEVGCLLFDDVTVEPP
jgi:hypothetical protein